MVGVAIAVGVVSVLRPALRPPSPRTSGPFAPMRAALGLVIALAGAATYYADRCAG